MQTLSKEEFIAFRQLILETPEGQTMVSDKLTELRKELGNLQLRMENVKKKAAEAPDEQDWFFEDWLNELDAEVKMAYARVRKFKNMLADADGMVEVQQDFDLDMIKRTVPIATIIDRQARMKFRDRDVYFCPLHNEKTPSFVVYKKNNTWYCFGACQKGGDVVALYMEIYGCSFIQACKQLTN